MSAFNIVRFRVKPGQETRFLDAHRDGKANWPGLQRGSMIKTGEHTYCLIGEWADTNDYAAAKSPVIAEILRRATAPPPRT